MGTPNLGVTLGGEDHDIKLFGFSDSGFDATGKTRLGVNIFLS